jgi:hypothetical protein
MGTPEVGRLVPAALLALLLVAALPAPAAAQGLNDQLSAVVDEYIERTDELISWGREIVDETDSGTAREVLKQAYDLNRRAERTNSMGRARQAGDLAKRARAALWHAVKLARESMNLQERLRVRAERFRELHQQLVERARDGGNEEALELLRRAERQALRAREQQLQGDARMAWQMFERAEDLTLRAARLLAEAGDPERLAGELDRIAELIERAREQLGADSPAPARRRLAEAEEALERARRHLEQGEPGRALQMAGLARRLARGALDATAAGPGAEALDRQLERFDERAERLGPAVRESARERVQRLFNEAADHRARAARDRDRGDFDAGLRQIRAGHDLLNQIERMLS